MSNPKSQSVHPMHTRSQTRAPAFTNSTRVQPVFEHVIFPERIAVSALTEMRTLQSLPNGLFDRLSAAAPSNLTPAELRAYMLNHMDDAAIIEPRSQPESEAEDSDQTSTEEEDSENSEDEEHDSEQGSDTEDSQIVQNPANLTINVFTA